MAVVIGIVFLSVGVVTAVSQVEVDIVVIIFVLLGTLHVGITDAFVDLIVFVVIFLFDGDGLFLDCVSGWRCGWFWFNCWRSCRLGRCVVVVAL